MTTRLEVLNIALRNLKIARVADIIETATSKDVNAAYDSVIDRVFSSKDWLWASRNTPLIDKGESSYRQGWRLYSYPITAKRIIRVYQRGEAQNSYRIYVDAEGIHTSATEAACSMVEKQDEGKWPDLFADAAGLALAAEFAIKYANDDYASIVAAADFALAAAVNADADRLGDNQILFNTDTFVRSRNPDGRAGDYGDDSVVSW